MSSVPFSWMWRDPAEVLDRLRPMRARMAIAEKELKERERRRKAVERGRKSLDLLDELKLALMSGSDVGPALTRLEKTASALGETSGEPGLDGLIEAIDLRVAVELAKHRRGPR